jgi:predicted phage terminase large subunit-like protein
VHTETVTGDKATRLAPFAAQAEAGNVSLLQGAWNGQYLDELTAFPNGAHDDQVDATSGAFNKLTRGGARRARSRQG